jgi:hypothetical protein
MNITFFDDPQEAPRPREDVRIKMIGLFVYPEARRMAFTLELTPFIERPCIDVQLQNGLGQPAGSLSVIETLNPVFNLTLHLRDQQTVDPYQLTAKIYYMTPDTERTDVDSQHVSFNATEEGEKLFQFEG